LSTAEDVRLAYAEGFEALRAELFGLEAALLLLKAVGGAQKFRTLLALSEAWAAEFSEFFGSTTFQVARDDDEFNAAAKEASHVIVVGSERAALNNQLFEVDSSSTIPAGIEPYWRIRAKQSGGRYVPA
jgi:hypothetical protein